MKENKNIWIKHNYKHSILNLPSLITKYKINKNNNINSNK